jgi:hypothetical protein
MRAIAVERAERSRWPRVPLFDVHGRFRLRVAGLAKRSHLGYTAGELGAVRVSARPASLP